MQMFRGRHKGSNCRARHRLQLIYSRERVRCRRGCRASSRYGSGLVSEMSDNDLKGSVDGRDMSWT